MSMPGTVPLTMAVAHRVAETESGDSTPAAGTGAERYLNRELSWLDFNDRVLQLAEDESLPLIERLKFVAIFTNNLDEFFMIRVAGVHDQVDAGIDARGPDGLSPGTRRAPRQGWLPDRKDAERRSASRTKTAHLRRRWAVPRTATSGTAPRGSPPNRHRRRRGRRSR